MTHKQKSTNLVWLDLEMTGLDPKTCTILEIGVCVTDGQLNVVAEGPAIAIHHSKKTLEGMESWSRFHHGKSGLTEACRKSKTSMKAAEEAILQFVKTYCKEKTAPLCGNTVWQDRRFLVKYMPRIESYLHYRMIDVSSLKELVLRWYPKDHKLPRVKHHAHRVEDDIRESLRELRHYREKVFVPIPELSP